MKKFIAILLLATTVLALCSCGKKDENKTTLPEETSDIISEVESTAAPTQDVSTQEAPTQEATTQADVPDETSESVPAPTVTQEDETTVTAIPSTIPEIVEYFNAASNAIKVDKPGYTATNSHKIGKITSESKFIEKVAGWIVPMFDEDPKVTTVAKGANHNNYPVAGQSWSSKLEPSAVSSATCIEKGDNYIIEIKLKSESLADLPKDPSKTNHGKVVSVLTADEVYTETDKFKSIASIESFAPTYSNSFIKCTVNKNTGKVVNSEYHFNTNAKVKAKVKLAGELSCNVPFEIVDKYTLNY
ncbi:MAG: hypothetical protein K5756_09880 [Clostridiales bacterium]|nr:hypothetical protein [Clostridiales bacterium]